MKKQFSQLHHIERNETITKEDHYEFLHHLENALLLALREQGRLDLMQYRHADESLRQQRLDRAKRILEKESEV